ncbi:MAG: hypothetical protein AAF826_00120 [Pseudomonadota bacterium]
MAYTNQLSEIGLDGFYDGIGRDEFESYGFTLRYQLPFRAG